MAVLDIRKDRLQVFDQLVVEVGIVFRVLQLGKYHQLLFTAPTVKQDTHYRRIGQSPIESLGVEVAIGPIA